MDAIDSVKVNGLPFDEWNAIETRRLCLEWAMERTPQHTTTDEVLAAAEGFARFVYGRNELNAAGATLPTPDGADQVVVPLHKSSDEPPIESETTVARWEVESGLVAFSSIKGNGAVVSVCLGPGGFPNLTVSIGGLDIKSPIPEAAMSEIIKIFSGGGDKTCA